ncbi:WD40 repeat domain-containing protein [Pseudanabaena yagii]|uniref:WD40 repeat domain-containing protein n=1 Tax=Pseudanabaena yagii GIHE-NHR1 TaxID=2722753 RepID=A0ABX1LQR1_9CYAN|nr:WD40 repeat domain-containing protein [Pseudanabaena yagii]NMF58459.1 WD40 repeat domain-containing protein [Pseudanabaena yagii GIHE-NHR1]
MSVADVNQKSLRQLTRIVQLSQGFSLSIALSNYRVLQKRVLQDLRSQLAENGLPETAIATLELKPDAKTLLAPIQELMGEVHQLPTEQKPKVLMVLGLDAVTEIEAVLKSANRVREEFANCLEFPMILWLNDRTQDILTREASDLANWTTAGAIEFQLETEELKDLVQVSTEAMFDRFIEIDKRETSLHAEISTSSQQFELMSAITELEDQEIAITPELRANLDFAFGCIAFTDKEITQAQEFFQKSLEIFAECDRLKQAICLLQLGMCEFNLAFSDRYHKQPFYESSQKYFAESIHLFRQLERWDLVAAYINFLMATMEELLSREALTPNLSPSGRGEQEVDLTPPLLRERGLGGEGLESLAHEALALHQTYPNQLREAHDRAILASIKLREKDYRSAKEFAELALALYHEGEALKLSNLSFSKRYGYGKYEIWLARALEGLGDRQGAIRRLEAVKASWNHQYDAQIYVAVLEELRSLYTSVGLYLEAFETKQHQRSVEQQYGLRAFIGAGTLNPKREGNNPDPYTNVAPPPDEIAQEIEASGRMPDVEKLVDRIGQARFPLTVVHGDSGAGKSSILSGGVIPALRLRESFDGRRVLVLAVKTYKDWSGEIRRQLQNYFPDRDHDIDPIHHFKRNIDENYLTVLIFDQFEDFFFKKEDFRDRLPFYKFLKACLHTDFVRVVLSLREDYLHYLLECDRAVDLEKVENDILGKQVRYYLGDFTQKQARQVIEALTRRSQLRLEPELIDRLVTDLSGEQLRILPIELQVVGAQLESEVPPIANLREYLALTGDTQRKSSEVLVERWLENVVRDCGVANKELAERVLYALTGNEEKRPQKTQAELASELLPSSAPQNFGETEEVSKAPLAPQFWGGQENDHVSKSPSIGGFRGLDNIASENGGAENLSLVLAVLVGSGLAFRVSSSPDDRFQLIHDYLVSFIRKKYKIDWAAELMEERKKRELAEKEKDIYAVANRKAWQRIRVGSIFLGIASVAAIGIGIYAGKTFQDSQKAIAITQIEKQSAEAERLFKTQEFQAFLPAVRGAKRLKTFIKDSQQIEQYPSVSPLSALQLILRDGRERLQFWEVNVIVSRDGKRLATDMHRDGTVRIWDLDGKEIAKLQGLQKQQGEYIRSVEFSPNSTRIATIGNDKTVRIWDSDGKEIAKLRGLQEGTSSVVFSPDSTRIATIGNDKTVRIWDSDGKEIAKLRGLQEGTSSVVFSPDSTRIATIGNDKTVQIWDLDGKEIAKLQGLQEWGSSVVFSPDSTRIATIGNDKTVRIWDSDGKEIAKLRGLQEGTSSVVFSPDSTRIATIGNDKTVRIWDLDGREIAQLQGLQEDIRSVEFSPNSTRIATIGNDKTVRIWDSDGKEIAKMQEIQGGTSSVVFSPDSKRLVIFSEGGTVRIWDLDGKEIAKLQEHQTFASSVVFSPDGKRIATGGRDGITRIWDLDGKEITKLQGHQGDVLGIVFFPDGKKLQTYGKDGSIRIWDLDGKEIAKLQGHQGWLSSVAFSPDGKRLTTLGNDKTVRIWDLNGKELAKLQGLQEDIRIVGFSPDSKRIATIGNDRTPRIWDLDGKEIAKLQGHQGDVWSIVFSPDGKRIATSGSDGIARIWDLDGREIMKLQGHQMFASSVVFSPDGKRIATGGRDGIARIWDLDGKEIAKLQGLQEWGLSVEFSPDSTRIATIGNDKTVRIWDLDGKEIMKLQGLQGGIERVVFSPDGKRLALSSSFSFNKKALILDLDSKKVTELQGFQNWSSIITFLPDGKHLAILDDRAVQIWDLEGKEIANLRGHQGGIESVVFSPDGKRLATSSKDETVRIWDIQGRQIAEYQGYGYISEDFQFIATVPKENPSIVKLWRIQNLDEMLDSACARLRPYLTTNPDVSESDRKLCDK